MSAYLITGVAGTGKSTLENVFRDDGYATIDTDNGYAYWLDNETRKQVDPPKNELPSWYEKHDWYTNGPKLERAVRAHNASCSEPLLVFGNTADLYTFRDLFSLMFALEYNDENHIKERIHSRTTNDYGKDPVEFAALLSYYKPMQEKFQSVGAIAIDCSQPLEDTVRFIQDTVAQDNG